jgi:hypothetical protein
MLVLNYSLLNREYILINVPKALASIISMCNLHVTFVTKITQRYFTHRLLLQTVSLIKSRHGLRSTENTAPLLF